MEETWKDIDGYEGYYQISNLGRVKSLYDGRRNVFREKIMKPKLEKTGYERICLRKENKSKHYYVHRIVANAFLKVDENSKILDVNHKDENKQNNCVDNLEWCTRSYNVNYGKRNQESSKAMSIKVVQCEKSGKIIKIHEKCRTEDKTHNFNATCISSCCKGKRKTHCGYTWVYYSEVMEKLLYSKYYNGDVKKIVDDLAQFKPS